MPSELTEPEFIEYRLDADSEVKLTITDMNGRVVDQVINQKQSAGIQKATWKPEGISKGVYVYNLQTGEKTKTGKIVFR